LFFLNIYALYFDIFWLSILSHIGFFIAAFMLFFEDAKSYSLNFYLFFTLTLASYFLRSFSEIWYFDELSLITQAAGYLVLMIEAVKYFKIKIGSPIMLVYFFAIIGLNIYLLLRHVFELEPYFSNLTTLLVAGFYYFNLAVLGVIAFLYYLNSYSKKSMFFISLVLSIVFADILRDMGVFYFKDISVEVAESFIRIGSAIFVVLFFITKEKKLQLINFV
tara:strand:- start:14024 stop:14683 length:660 start_codon:yes stop_codon:yes gene_type:complete